MSGLDDCGGAASEIPDAQVAVLRAFLGQDVAETDRLNTRLHKPGDLAGIGELVLAMFVLAVRQRFAPEWTVPLVIKYVAAVRAGSKQNEEKIEPCTAETLIRRALDDNVLADLDETVQGCTQLLLLRELIADEQLDMTALDKRLQDARSVAHEWHQ